MERATDTTAVAVAALAAERTALEAERAQVERLRRDLLTTVSHELRTPLTLIRTSIGLLLDDDAPPDAEMRDRLLRNIKGSADRMNALVTDLLDLARLSAHAADLQLREVDLLELANGAAAMMRPLLDQKAQRLGFDAPGPRADTRVLGDARRLERVLLNLLSNATKFAPDGATITVLLRTGRRDVTAGVRDDGPGISEESQRLLFEQFYTDRTSSSSRNIGAGLGLPIAKGIVEAHGGRMWVESALGHGTTVWFAIPRDPGPGPEREAAEEAGA